MVTLTQLEPILAVERLRHFARATKICNVSQPSLSMQIQKVSRYCRVEIKPQTEIFFPAQNLI